MPTLALNKPFGVVCQFSSHDVHPGLSTCIATPGVYPAGRLDTDSEGLLLLTDDGTLQARIADPRHKLPKTYWAQVEGIPDFVALQHLRDGVRLSDFTTRPCAVRALDPPDLWERTPPVRFRKHIPTSWIELTISEGKNRQVRRMTAAVGFPTLRLVRVAIGALRLTELALAPGEHCVIDPAQLLPTRGASGRSGRRH
ncbi:pseudouridine synthase [Derxia lacustris]|uniref:pseudouridine synthase n=1 Tax=Derxia lacustris TaxID=764842 RepID=UPI000A174D05|nr:pseudouridine synthase [Derxia lacustris]